MFIIERNMTKNLPKQAKPAVFLDRDGTIIVEKGYISNPDDVELIAGAAEAIKILNAAEYPVVVVSNQSGVARGFFTEDDVKRVNERMLELLSLSGAHVDAVYYCPHHRDGVVPEYAIDCECRKPGLGMIKKAALELGVYPIAVVGDREADVRLAVNASVPGILVLTGYGERQPDEVKSMASFIAADLLEAAVWIEERFG